MQTTILIFLPMAGAIAVWIVPWGSRRAAGGFALLVALAELAFWVGTALNFDFANVGLQAESERRQVEAITAQIVNKLLHLPTVRMKEAAVTADGVVYADVVRHLFGLGEERRPS